MTCSCGGYTSHSDLKKNGYRCLWCKKPECQCHQATGDSPDCPTHGRHAKCRECFDEGIRYGHIVCDCAEGMKRRPAGIIYLEDYR